MESYSKNQKTSKLSRKKILSFRLLSVVLIFFIIIFIGEILLRLIPIPGIEFNTAKYDQLTGVGYYPNSLVHYRNDRGEFVKRKVNSWGYLDIEHNKEKKHGSYRIGFFGDSYTEAKQVPIENVFFRIIEKELNEYDVETLSFGISGYGTLHSFLNSTRWSDFFDLDLIVYVFVENDLGDQISTIRREPNLPYAILDGDDFTVDNSFREKNKFKNTRFFRFMDYINANSLLTSTLSQRLKLLLLYGIKTKVTKEDREMSANYDQNTSDKIPDQGDLPSTWPKLLYNYAIKLGSSVILKWEKEIDHKSKKYAILYVPRQSEYQKDTKHQDSWKPWLESFTSENNITFIDSTSCLVKMQNSGKDVFYDHFTKEGHKAFADAFVTWFKNNISVKSLERY